jgi:development and cell death domain-containing protein
MSVSFLFTSDRASPTPSDMKLYFFLCDHVTEVECLARQLVGTTEANIEWTLQIVPGDTIFMYNFQTGDMLGPFTATSGADCHEQKAWRGKFPVQVRFNKTLASRKINLRTQRGGEFLTSRGVRPPHVLEDTLLANCLLSLVAQLGSEL